MCLDPAQEFRNINFDSDDQQNDILVFSDIGHKVTQMKNVRKRVHNVSGMKDKREVSNLNNIFTEFQFENTK